MKSHYFVLVTFATILALIAGCGICGIEDPGSGGRTNAGTGGNGGSEPSDAGCTGCVAVAEDIECRKGDVDTSCGSDGDTCVACPTFSACVDGHCRVQCEDAKDGAPCVRQGCPGTCFNHTGDAGPPVGICVTDPTCVITFDGGPQ